MTNADYVQKIEAAASAVEERLGTAGIAIVLGSGLGGFTEQLTDATQMPFSEIPGFPVSTAPGHAGRWWAGNLCGKRVYMLQGCVHAYEGLDLRDVTMYVRMMKILGVQDLILTNACGCACEAWHAGELMMLTDFINLSGLNPLSGPNLDGFGPRFPDMTDAYDRELRSLCRKAAEAEGITLREGVYAWFQGPTYETPAEVRMAMTLGAQAVGMSTVPETIVARHCGIRVLGLSCMTNMAAGLGDGNLNHEEVLQAADGAKENFTRLICHLIGELNS